MNQKQVYTPLMVTGCIPFFAATIAPYVGLYELPIIGNLKSAISLYALAIVSFMSGTQWGLALEPQSNPRRSNAKPPMSPLRVMVTSNAMVVIPWLIYCILGAGISYYFSIAITLVLIVMTDYRLAGRKIITYDYCRIRLIVTMAILVCLISLAFTA